MSELPKYVDALLEDIIASKGFTNYTIEYKPGSNHGDNFLGVMTSVTVSGIRNEKEAQLHLVCKLAPSNAARREEFKSGTVFLREAIMYNEILPLFTEFQREKGLCDNDAFKSYPKCYKAIADEAADQMVIIMEDMRPKGFTMYPRNKPTTAENVFKLVEQLGRFHGISFALKHQRPAIYERLQQLPDIFCEVFLSDNFLKSLGMGYDRAIASLKDEKHIEILSDVKANMKEYMCEMLREGACGDFGVIAHGDPHLNNILYKYQNGYKNIEDICLVDWQLSRFCSPALDLHYTLFCTTNKELRDVEYENIMKHYHNSLSDIVRKLGSDPDKLFPFTEFQKSLKKFGKFAFLMGPVLTQIMLADPKDVPDLDEMSVAMSKSDVEFVQGFDEETQLQYDERINDMMTDLIEYGYYWK